MFRTIKYDLEDQSMRLSFYTFNPWYIADYNDEDQPFSFRQEEEEDTINNDISLKSEFSES